MSWHENASKAWQPEAEVAIPSQRERPNSLWRRLRVQQTASLDQRLLTMSNGSLLQVVLSCGTGGAVRGRYAMSARRTRARSVLLRGQVMAAVLISFASVLASMVPAPQAVADAAPLATSPAALLSAAASPVVAYVTNYGSGTVTPIDTATNTAGPPITVGSYPYNIAITPDGKTAYVGNVGSGTVTPIATATNTAGPAITVGASPQNIGITPDGKTVYVVNEVSGTETPIATAAATAGSPITVGASPYTIAITPDGKTAYVADYGSGTVTPIATATDTPGPPITVGTNPFTVAITPDGKTAYVTNEGSGTVTPIATATNTAGPPITVGTFPENIAITPDGETAYVTHTGSNTVTPIANATNTAGTPIPVGMTPYTIAITPNGETAYVANFGSGTVTPIATASNTAGPPITVGTDPYAIAIMPATVTQSPAFTSGAAATAAFGSAFSFTVTATGDPAPRITRNGRLPSGVRFADNGDGTATISGTPSDAGAGVYPLTLTARNKNGTAIQAFTLTVTRAPAIRTIRSFRVRVGAVLSRTVRATGYPAPALTEFGTLPAGLSFTDNGNGTAVIAGSPASGTGGSYPVTITATNTSGTATQRFIITVT
jgi:YVTN family beta-propeller protein